MRSFARLLGPLMAVLVILTGAVAAHADTTPTSGLAPAADPRFGVAIAGLTDDGAAAEQIAPDVLRALGVSWWYTYAPAPPIPGTHRLELTRPPSVGTDLAARAQANPGAYWLMGNEPNVPGQDNVTPAAFATWYHDTAQAILAADPSAHFVGPNLLNWDVTCTGCEGYTTAHVWSDSFLAAYQAQYGAAPRIDVWGMHVYDLDWENPPLIHTQTSFDQIQSARAWLDAQPTLANTPIWITEFGVIFGYDGYSVTQSNGQSMISPVGPFRQDLVNGYVGDMVSFLTSQGPDLNVQRWFIFSALAAREPYQTTYAGVALLHGPKGALQLTAPGQIYVSAAQGALPTPTAASPTPTATPGGDDSDSGSSSDSPSGPDDSSDAADAG